MYDPVKDGVNKTVEAVSYVEIEPPEHLAELVHCFWEMRSEEELAEDFVLHALPDACVNILFDHSDLRVAGLTALHTSHITLNLGRRFHYAGVQLFPGVWQGNLEDTVDHYVGEPYRGDLPLERTNRRLVAAEADDKPAVFAEFVDELVADGIVAPNPIVASVLRNLDDIHSVADMARVAALSARQLQRIIKADTGFSPHDLLKVLRLQHTFRSDYQLAFADQAHFTRSFRNVMGYTPARFHRTFDVE